MEIVSRIKENTRLVKFAESAGRNQKIQKEINEMIEKLRLGSKTLFRNVKELRDEKGGRVYYRKSDGKILNYKFMVVKKISFPVPLTNIEDIDVFVDLENGRSYTE